MDPRLEPARIPDEARGLWESFFALSAARRSGMSAQPLTYTDLDAWCRLTGTTLTPWELETLTIMDAAALTTAHRNTTK